MKQKNIVFAIDLHGVLFKHNYKKMLNTLFKSKKKLKLILALFNPYLWIDTIKLIKKNAIAEEFLVDLANKHTKLKQFVPLGIKIANLQVPQQEVIETLKKLKKNGYNLYLFSNIGLIIFKDLQKKFPQIFELFENFTTPSKKNGYIRKPSNKAFINLIIENNLQNKKIILIDDKKKNVNKAKQLGLEAILFKSNDQIGKELKNLIK